VARKAQTRNAGRSFMTNRSTGREEVRRIRSKLIFGKYVTKQKCGKISPELVFNSGLL
jgi:hypothetical protein